MKSLIFFLLLSFQASAQKISMDALIGSHYNTHTALMGSNLSTNLLLNTFKNDRIRLLFIVNFYRESNKVKSYGNLLADGVGIQQISFTKGVGIEYFINESKKISISGSILHTNTIFNQKRILDNNIKESIFNKNSVGFSPNLNYYYPTQKNFVYFKANAGILISYHVTSPFCQFGLGYNFTK